MQGLGDFIIPYLIVQGISLLFLFVSGWRPRLGRLMFASLFLYGAVFNMQMALSDSGLYLMIVASSLPLYRDFIEGWVAHYHNIVIPCFAGALFLVGTGMLLNGRWVKGACIGAIVFLLILTPFAGGLGFPFSVVTALAAFRILKKDHKEFIWVSTVPRKLFSR